MDSDSKVKQLHALAESLVVRSIQRGSADDIHGAISLDRKALELCPPDHPRRYIALVELSVHLSDRYGQLESLEDLEEAVAVARDAVAVCSPGHPDRSMALSTLAVCLHARYVRLSATEDLDEAVTFGREALALRPPGHPNRPLSLDKLATFLSARYERLKKKEDIDEAIVLGQDARALFPLGHPVWSTSSHNLGCHLFTRYEHFGDIEDLDKAIELGRNLLELHALSRPISLKAFATHLETQYHQLGELNEAILIKPEQLVLRPPANPDHPSCLNNLATRLSLRFRQRGQMEDLNEAISLVRRSLALRPRGHPSRSLSLNGLATTLSIRHKQLGAMEDLNEAIALSREALALTPLGDSDHWVILSNLAAFLLARGNLLETLEDLDEAIALNRQVLALCPPEHADISSSLNNLASSLTIRFQVLRKVEDLEEPIVLGRIALALRPQGHPLRLSTLHNLALRFSTRFHHLRSKEDLDTAISLGYEALTLSPPGHLDRSRSLATLASFFRLRSISSRRVEDIVKVFALCAQLAYVPPMIAASDMSAAREWVDVAEQFQHPTTLAAYKTSFRLLIHHLSILPSLPQHFSVLKSHTSSLAVDAFSAFLRNRRPTTAVEFLEQGRGAFWNQLARLRSPLDEVTTSGAAGKALADEFTRLTLCIGNAFDSSEGDQHDRVCNLNLELQKVVAKIRELPDLSCFLLPLPFSDLRQAACEGPVIIVNASKYGCDALVVLADQDPVRIPLSITKKDVQGMSSELGALTVLATSMNVTRELGRLLREIWSEVVSPIVDLLQTIHPSQSRIWWCPTAEFSLLPLHAAGPYRKGQYNLADLYISSYTPTLGALIHARRNVSVHSASGRKRFVAIGEANAPGENELVSVGAELAHIGRRVDALATFTRLEGAASCIARVGEELGQNDWVHLACHGIPSPRRPFESAFALHDGRFTIERILRCELQNPEFAYLSACHTTVGDEESPDEVIHLASAMHFAGFRSVIGTMWTVDDGQASRITAAFYDGMVDEVGRLDHTRAARALNRTMKRMRDMPLDQRILYVHLGA